MMATHGMDSIAQLWWSWTQATLLQGMAALAIIALLWPWVRRWPSGWRYALGMLLLLKFVLPWPLEVAVPVASSSISPPVAMEEPLAPMTPRERVHVTEAPIPSEAPAASLREESRRQAAVMESLPPSNTSAWSWKSAAFALWLAGLLAFWGWLGRKAWRITRIARRAQRDIALEKQLGDAAIRRGASVHWCAESATPMLVGFWRPRILIPTTMREETPERLRLLLAHEEEHVARRDHQLLWLKALLVSLYWWNPLVYWLSARIDDAMEENCDERVLRRNPDSAIAYGRLIVDAAETQSLRAALYAPAAFAESKHSLMRRIQRIVDFRPEARTSRLGLTLAALCVAVLIVPTWTLSESQSHQIIPQNDSNKFNFNRIVIPIGAVLSSSLDGVTSDVNDADETELRIRREARQLPSRNNTNIDSSHPLYSELQKLFLLPDVEKAYLECEVTWTIYQPSNFANAIQDGFVPFPDPRGEHGDAQEAEATAEAQRSHYSEEWQEKQKETRSQTYQQIITIDNGVWKREVIASAGDIFPIDQHQLQIIDLNNLEWKTQSLNKPSPERAIHTQPIDKASYQPLRNTAFNPVSMGELMGVRESFQLLLEVARNRPAQILIGSNLLSRYSTDSAPTVPVTQFEENAEGRLLRAIYLEAPTLTPPTRELIYGDYVTDSASGVEYPREVTLKRYLRTGIEHRSPERLTEEATVRITQFTTKF